MAKKSIEDQIKGFLEMWPCESQMAFLRDILPLFELFDVEDDKDWVVEAVGEENQANVRIIRTIYIMSKIADSYAGRLATLRVNFPALYRKMEEYKV